MSSNRVIRRADPSTIHNKVLVGYQGWFTCAGDGPPVHRGHHGWLHWFDKPLPEGGHPNFDLFPDVTDYAPEELYPVPGLTFPHNNQPAKLFSSRNPNTVNRHFHWMARHGIDGAFLQRFAAQCEVDGNPTSTTADLMRLRDEVLDRVREAAEKEHRAWAIMYDVSGVSSNRIEHVLRVDWNHLLNDKRILDSPYYLKEKGQPVVAIWGFGFVRNLHDPQTVASIVRHIKSVTPGGAYIWGGVPSQWRTLSGDMMPEPAFLDVFKNEFNALSPWTIGRYNNLAAIDRFCDERMRDDFKELKDLPNRIDYIPTVWPGGSSYNLSGGTMGLNDAPREGGKFLWRQLWNFKHLGARTIYVAMFDEYDEGTAILPAVPLKRSLPKCEDPNRQFPFIALDADGVDNLSPDWYLRICGFASEVMKDERRVYEDLPKKELDDYWATRPKYEIVQETYASSSNQQSELPYLSGGGGGSSSVANTAAAAPVSTPASTAKIPERKDPMRKNTGAWGLLMGDDEEGAPPPYSLEAIEDVPVVTTPATVATGTTATATATATVTATATATTPTPVATPSAASNVTAPTTSPSVVQPGGGPTPSSNAGIPVSSPSGVGVQRVSSYAAPSPNANQGATGLGRSSTYTPTSTQSITNSSPARPLFAPPSFAPPSTAPPRPTSAMSHSSTGSVTQQRPPIHPASPLAAGSSSSTGVSTPPLSQSPYKKPESLPMNSGGSVSNVTHHLSHMNIASSSHHTHMNPHLAQAPNTSTGVPSHATGQGHAGKYPVHQPSGSLPSTPGAGPSYPSTPATAPQPTGFGAGGFVAPTPSQQQGVTPSWTGQAQPQPNSYMTAGQGTSYGTTPGTPGTSGGVPPSGVAPGQPASQAWGSPSTAPPQQQPGWVNPLAGPSFPPPGTTTVPGGAGFIAPGSVPPAAPTAASPSSYPTTQPSLYPPSHLSSAAHPDASAYPLPGGATSNYPGGADPSAQGWTNAYPSAGPYPTPGAGPSSGANPPGLPPRPPGQGPQNPTFLGGIVKQATGVVDRVAGEKTRIQIEKGVISAAQTGSKLLGKLTK
ncbi:hypothetical protein FRC17_007440 [Serendipita sp. 399]|nr:hypothetical protein FRC17_007440 [Serendipita sp. 399]